PPRRPLLPRPDLFAEGARMRCFSRRAVIWVAVVAASIAECGASLPVRGSETVSQGRSSPKGQAVAQAPFSASGNEILSQPRALPQAPEGSPAVSSGAAADTEAAAVVGGSAGAPTGASSGAAGGPGVGTVQSGGGVVHSDACSCAPCVCCP